jgi:hypothetical protein
MRSNPFWLNAILGSQSHKPSKAEVIGAMQLALPNEPKIPEAFHRTCAPLFDQAEANRAQSRPRATLRDTLLPKPISGELRLPAAMLAAQAGVADVESRLNSLA